MERKRSRGRRGKYFDGQLLVAMPGMRDPRFERAVIYVCAHSAEGAMGIRINDPAPLTLGDILVQLEIVADRNAIPETVSQRDLPVQRGGPVDTARGFVLHSPDYRSGEATLAVDGEISLTATVDILKAIATGGGPRQALLALGYAGWAAGQLEREMADNGWLTTPAPSSLIFSPDVDGKYGRALGLIGVDPAMLSGDAGHA